MTGYIVGAEGCGKTQLAMEFGAMVSNQSLRREFDGDQSLTPSSFGKVVFFGVEDDINSAIVPRFGAAGGKCENLYVEYGQFSTKIVDRLQYIDGLKLLILDDWNVLRRGYPPGAQEIKRSIEDLLTLAKNMQFGVVVVGHFSKSAKKSASPIYRTDMPKELRVKFRSVFFVEPIGENFRDKSFGLIPAKTSYGSHAPGVAFRIVSREYQGVQTSGIEWLRSLDDDEIEQLLRRSATKQAPIRGSLEIAIDFLKIRLAGGPVPYKTLCAEATGRGISEASLKRAKATLKIVSEKARGEGQFSGFLWKIPRDSDG